MWGDLPEATSVVISGLGAPGKPSLNDVAIQDQIEALTVDVEDSPLTYQGTHDVYCSEI